MIITPTLLRYPQYKCIKYRHSAMYNTVQLPYSFTVCCTAVGGTLYVGTELNREFMSTDFHGPIPMTERSKVLV